MKKLLLFSVSILMFFVNYAQNDFAPLGAEWYHSGGLGTIVYKSYAANDTVILGKSCRRILQQAYIKPSDLSSAKMYQVSRPLYIYGNEDTTFIYNEYYMRFTPLYVFNVKAGDTIRLNPIPGVSCKSPYARDTNKVSLTFLIDSVKNINYGGSLLKTVYSRAVIEKESSLAWSRFDWDSKKEIPNVYAQKLGSLYGGFVPYCINKCVMLTVEGCPIPDTLLCYKDAISDVHFISGACDKDYTSTAIKDVSSNKNQLELHPNPASSLLFIDGANMDFKNELSIYNSFGQKVLVQNFEVRAQIQINVSSLDYGLYFVRLKNLSDQSFTNGKFIKN